MADQANPFLALFGSEEEATLKELSATKQKKELCALLTRIFLFTGTDYEGQERSLLSSLPRYLVRLPQLARNEASRGCSGTLSMENCSEGLDERLLVLSSDLEVLDLQMGMDKQMLFDKNYAVEPSAVKYLAECYARAELEGKPSAKKKSRAEADEDFSRDKAATISQCKKEIVDRASIVIRTDNARVLLLRSAQPSFQFVQLLKNALSPGSSIPVQFFYDVAECQSDNLEAQKAIFDVVLEDLYSSLAQIKLSSPQLDDGLNIIAFFTSQPLLCKVLTNFKHWFPSNIKRGRAFETETILGRYLSPTCMAELPEGPSSYFPLRRGLYRADVEETTMSVRNRLDTLTVRLCKIFECILRASPDCKKALITWLVLCFASNNDRAKMGSLIHPEHMAYHNQATDGFFVNLSWVMLRLCTPFMVSQQADAIKTARIKTIDVSYCAFNADKVMSADTGGPLVDFSGDSKLVPHSGDATQDPLDVSFNLPFNFITHCFFLTHKCLMLGTTHVLSKYQNIRRNVTHLHGVNGLSYEIEVPPGTPQWFLRCFTSQLLGIQAHALDPMLVELSLSFYATTAQWMVQQVVGDDECSIPDKPPSLIRIIPECLIENMSTVVMTVRQMRQVDTKLTLQPHHSNSYLSFCTIFMRSSSFVNNPHMRAKMAKLVRLVIHRDEVLRSNLDIDVQRDLFSKHVMAREHLMMALLSIFIDIERTGESMEFEDKFEYRLPMYDTIEFLWNIPAYRPSIERLSEEVVLYSEATQKTPVFLRFINMIINDAIIQLDEGLENLAIIKKLEDLQNSDRWATLNDEKKTEHEEKLKEAKMYAANRNSLGDKTVHMLKVIITDVRRPFVIPGIVDRMAAMLNYVLKHLVGKTSKNFKVRDAERYHFNPQVLVSNIVDIYINLGHEKCFCEALPRDGRSFSMDLFGQAERVLWIISGDQHSVISEWRKLSAVVKDCSEDLILKETLFKNPPDEFLDPFTQELMDDPVILPTSGHIVDRSSIMRHLLSDQQDPFNRAPLTPDMLQTNHDLRDRIIEWKRGKMTTE